MRMTLLTSIAICSLQMLQAKDSMKEAKKEADAFAKEKLSSLRHKLNENEGFDFTVQDFLPEEDKGKEIDLNEANKSFKQSADFAEASEISGFLEKTKKRDEIEDSEEFIVNANTILLNPNPSADIDFLSSTVIPEEETLHTCQEGGNYQAVFIQMLTVQASPEIKQTIKHCSGHEKKKEFFWKSDAKSYIKHKEEELKGNKEIASYDAYIDKGNIVKDYVVIIEWRHHDQAHACDAFSLEDKIIQNAREKDSWRAEDSEGLAFVESNPSCKLLYSQVVQGPETRSINGKAVYRDIWGRQLYFSCEADKESKCQELRQQGGVIVSKKCLEENCLGECSLWEKTYDIGKKGAFQQVTASFKDQEIWGFNDAFETSYEKNVDFGPAVTTLSVFSDLESSLEEDKSDLYEKAEIFKGETFKCQKSFVGDVFDCCRKMEGIAVNVKLANCSSEEKSLAEKRNEGKCHFVGSQKVKLGTVSEHVYCCFPTKLARIVQEQGRKQLSIKWGSAEHPKCHGLKLAELQSIDFNKIDFSEIVEGLKIDKQTYEAKLKQNIDSLQKKIQGQVQQKKHAAQGSGTYADQ